MADSIEDEQTSPRFQWTPGKVILAELGVLLCAILAMIPIMMMGIGLSPPQESDVPWWLNLYLGDILLIALTIISIPATGLVAFILWLSRDE